MGFFFVFFLCCSFGWIDGSLLVVCLIDLLFDRMFVFVCFSNVCLFVAQHVLKQLRTCWLCAQHVLKYFRTCWLRVCVCAWEPSWGYPCGPERASRCMGKLFVFLWSSWMPQNRSPQSADCYFWKRMQTFFDATRAEVMPRKRRAI